MSISSITNNDVSSAINLSLLANANAQQAQTLALINASSGTLVNITA